MCDEYLQRKLPEEVIGRLKLYIYMYIIKRKSEKLRCPSLSEIIEFGYVNLIKYGSISH